MARGLNKVQLIGNLGQDPETRHTAGGTIVTNFSLATNESWNDRQSGDRREKTEWHRIVMFNKLAEIAEKYLQKGQQVYVEGKLQTDKWQDKEGNDRYTTKIIANQMLMLGGGREGGGEGGGDSDGGGYQRRESSGGGQSQRDTRTDQDIEDEIPF